MIISHKYRFIFIHCRKVAGSSIKTSLWPYLGDNDIVIGSLDEVLRHGYGLNSAAKRALLHPRGWNILRKASIEHLRNGKSQKYQNLVNTKVKARYKKMLFRNPVHPPAERVKQAFPYEWDNYFKFCFVRNSYDQALSEYSHQMKNSGRDVSFRYFLEALSGKVEDRGIVPSGLITNWSLYAIDDRPVADFIGHYENLNNDFAGICKKLDIPFDGPLREEKVGRNGRKKDLSHWYDAESVSIVKSIYEKEVEYFNVVDPLASK
ncbi:hypothetical protein GCM10007160_41810 [Litchfieldella qijiaojingensis]|uniref:Sulfotransferase family protein n=1 Tax=Litchfieldella qijiaojingensis TaxID=980347 RepID=A0ABQ2ZAF5_9GAMM|nr:sulfotransferase family 2 domain-containing protein [Halomonas qijiaojingensis]GGY10245.1 hypothetical protein GCM10007160_41810 [Halomonas qijiaojingensis]